MHILFAGGGSIGHLAPAVAVWRAVETSIPDAAMHFACSTRPEDAEFLEREKIAFTPLCDRRFSVLRPDLFLRAILRARTILTDFQPDVIFSKGGAVSVPICIVAYMRRIPVVLHESDAVMGKASQFITSFAKTICIGIQETRNQPFEALTGLQARNGKPETSKLFTGNPIRPAVTTGDRARGLSLTGFSGKRPILLVMGGSQGAQALNDAVLRNLDALIKVADVVHLTGKGKYGAKPSAAYWTQEIAYEELPDLYAIASLALSRSGAGSISELAANGIPSLLVPLRGLAQDHQLRNADVAVQSGGAMLLHQEQLNVTLPQTVKRLVETPAELEAMRTAMRTLAVPDAAQKIANTVLATARCTDLSRGKQ